MKKFIFLIALAAGMFVTAAHAQVNLKPLITNAQHSAGLDTVTNAGVVNQSGTISGYNNVITIQSVINKLTGTVAGVVRLYGSLDNVNFSRILPADSLILGNVATQSKIFVVAPSSVTYYRIVTTGSGTQTATVKSTAIWRRP